MRERLLRAAREVFNERDPARVKLREIADRAGVNPALLHYYFGTRRGLWAAILDQLYARLRECLQDAERARANRSVSEQLQGLIAEYVEILGHEAYLAIMLAEEMYPARADPERFWEGIGGPLSHYLAGLFEEGVASGELQPAPLPFRIRESGGLLLFHLILAPFLAGALDRNSSPEAIEFWKRAAPDLILRGLLER